VPLSHCFEVTGRRDEFTSFGSVDIADVESRGDVASWRDDGLVTEVRGPVLLGGYAAKQCPVRVQNDFLPLVPTLKWVPSPEDQSRLDAGIAFEKRVFDQLVAIHPNAIVVGPQLGKADAIAMTVEAMNAGAPLVLGGWLPDDVEHGRTGRPDILIKADHGYHPGDVKNHLSLKPLKSESVTRAVISPLASPGARFEVRGWTAATPHRYEDGIQLAHYTRMLEACGFRPGGDQLWGAVLGTSQLRVMAGEAPQWVLVWHDLDEPLFVTFSRSHGKTKRSLLARYDHEHAFRVKVAETARHITGGDDDPQALVEPVGQQECVTCPYEQRCNDQMGRDDPSTAITIGRLKSREWLTLRRMGVTTTAGLSAVNPDDPLFFDEYFAEVSHLTRDEARRRLVGAIERADMICDGIEIEQTTVGPVDVPVADVEIDIDVEYDPNNLVYMWGVRLRRGADDETAQYVADFVDWDLLDSSREQTLAERFATWLRCQRDEAAACGQTLKVFHWSHPERSKLKSILGLAEVGDLIGPETGLFIDLEQVFKANFVSLHGSSIKKVAPHFGFTWRVDDPGGAISQTYLAKVHTSADPDDVVKAKQWLLTYNEDDNAAMAAIRDGMRFKRP
jgi:predicted RecB family nuclease